MMGKVSTDAHTYQDTFLSLMSNQAAADNFAGQVMDSIVKTIMKVSGLALIRKSRQSWLK